MSLNAPQAHRWVPEGWPAHGSPTRTTERYEWRDPEGGWHVGEPLATHGDYTVLRCSPCCLIHVTPLPPTAWLAHYYATAFYTRSHPDYVARYREDMPWWTLHHTAMLQQLGGLRRQNGHQPAILDIGTGPGLFLDTARALGWQTWGLEPDVQLAASVRQRGHMVSADTLTTMCEATAHGDIPRFDAVHCYEVLEHLHEPEAVLLQCWDLLQPEGLLAVVVPNDFNPLQLEACARHGLPYWWVQPPEHLTYFAPTTLKLLLRRCGFHLLDLHGTYPMERFMLPEEPGEPALVYVGNDALGRQCHRARMAWELARAEAGQWSVVEALYRYQLLVHGVGREMVAVAKKHL